MKIDVSGVKASADHAVATMHKLVELVEKALASTSDADDAAVQAELDAVKVTLDGGSAEGDAEVAKATPAPAPEPAPPAPAPEVVLEPAPAADTPAA